MAMAVPLAHAVAGRRSAERGGPGRGRLRKRDGSGISLRGPAPAVAAGGRPGWAGWPTRPGPGWSRRSLAVPRHATLVAGRYDPCCSSMPDGRRRLAGGRGAPPLGIWEDWWPAQPEQVCPPTPPGQPIDPGRAGTAHVSREAVVSPLQVSHAARKDRPRRFSSRQSLRPGCEVVLSNAPIRWRSISACASTVRHRSPRAADQAARTPCCRFTGNVSLQVSASARWKLPGRSTGTPPPAIGDCRGRRPLAAAAW